MAGTTTNNGWDYPTSTDLLKDGALAIQTLATDIDTSVGTGLLPWKNYTFVISSGSGTIGSTTINRARYVKLGRIVHVFFDFTILANGTGTTNIIVALPIATVNNNSAGTGKEVAATGNALTVFLSGSNGVITFNNNAYPGGTNYRLACSFTYEVA